MQQQLFLARIFAKCLDADDYEAARTTLAADCRCDTGKAILTGPEAIIESYRNSSVWARSTFDDVRFESRIEQDLSSPYRICVFYSDILRKAGDSHVHQCRQFLTIDEASTKITAIEHLEVDAEAARLEEFFERIGVRRNRSGGGAAKRAATICDRTTRGQAR